MNQSKYGNGLEPESEPESSQIAARWPPLQKQCLQAVAATYLYGNMGSSLRAS